MSSVADKSKKDELTKSEVPPVSSNTEGDQLSVGQANEKEDNQENNVRSNYGSWFTSILQTAKDTTYQTLESMKNDINEFSDTVQQEVGTIASNTSSVMKSQAQSLQRNLQHQFNSLSEIVSDTNEDEANNDDVSEKSTSNSESASGNTVGVFGTKWVKTLVETVQKLGMEDTTKDESKYTEELRVGLPRKTNLDQCQLLQLQNDEQTFLQPPAENIDLYREWLMEFKIVEYNGEINLLLSYNPRLREIYSRLVPAKIDNHTFWNRYFFKVHMKELDKSLSTSLVKTKESGNSGERDETWSICGSAVNDIQDLEETSAEGSDLKTPQLSDSEEKKSDGKDTTLDDEWEECCDNGSNSANETK